VAQVNATEDDLDSETEDYSLASDNTEDSSTTADKDDGSFIVSSPNGKAPRQLADIEVRRLNNIERNNAHLMRLGLRGGLVEGSIVAKAAPKRRKAASFAESAVPSRKSRRLEAVAKPSYADDDTDCDSDSNVAD
jgi:hypothetical protein